MERYLHFGSNAPTWYAPVESFFVAAFFGFVFDRGLKLMRYDMGGLSGAMCGVLIVIEKEIFEFVTEKQTTLVNLSDLLFGLLGASVMYNIIVAVEEKRSALVIDSSKED